MLMPSALSVGHTIGDVVESSTFNKHAIAMPINVGGFEIPWTPRSETVGICGIHKVLYYAHNKPKLV